MNLEALKQRQVQKQTIVRSVQYEFVPADQNGGMSSVSLTLTLKLECTGQLPAAFSATALQQLLHR